MLLHYWQKVDTKITSFHSNEVGLGRVGRRTLTRDNIKADVMSVSMLDMSQASVPGDICI